MTIIRKLAVPAAIGVLLFVANIPPEPSRHLLGIQLIADAHAIFGVRRRSLAFGYMAGYAAAEDDDGNGNGNGNGNGDGDGDGDGNSNSNSKDSDGSASKSSASQQSTTKKKTTTQPATTGKVLALGTVVKALPGACTTKSSGGIEYYYCAPNYYRAVFQGNNLVYVTAKP